MLLDTYSNPRLHGPSKLTLDRRGYVYEIGLESKYIHQLTPQSDLLQIVELESRPFPISYSDFNNKPFVGLTDDCSFYSIDIQNGSM